MKNNNPAVWRGVGVMLLAIVVFGWILGIESTFLLMFLGFFLWLVLEVSLAIRKGISDHKTFERDGIIALPEVAKEEKMVSLEKAEEVLKEIPVANEEKADDIVKQLDVIKNSKNKKSTTRKKTSKVKENEAPDLNIGTISSKKDGGRNSNERILQLHNEGKSNVAIAKELGLGIGEVKLVIDLFEGM